MTDKFTIVKKGYSVEEVDLYVVDMEQKLANYKKREGAVTNAIVSAQETAEQIIRNAELDAKEKLFEFRTALNDIRKMVESEKAALAEFCREYDGIVRKYFSGTAEEITAPLDGKISVLMEMLDENEEKDKRGFTFHAAAENTGAALSRQTDSEEKPPHNEDNSEGK